MAPRKGLCKEKNAKVQYRVHEVIFGEDIPAFVVLFPAANEQELLDNAKDWMAMGDEGAAIFNEGAQYARDIEEISNMRYLPNLAYFPSNE